MDNHQLKRLSKTFSRASKVCGNFAESICSRVHIFLFRASLLTIDGKITNNERSAKLTSHTLREWAWMPNVHQIYTLFGTGFKHNNTYGYPSSESVWLDSVSEWPVESKLGYPRELLLYMDPDIRLKSIPPCDFMLILGPAPAMLILLT